jgi:hypothetical protein
LVYFPRIFHHDSSKNPYFISFYVKKYQKQGFDALFKLIRLELAEFHILLEWKLIRTVLKLLGFVNNNDNLLLEKDIVLPKSVFNLDLTN